MNETSDLVNELYGNVGNSTNILNSDTNEPTYENHPSVLKQYTRKALRPIKRYLTKLGIEADFRNTKISLDKLPTFYRKFIIIGRDYIKEHLMPVGKIFGLYNPETKDIIIDPVSIPSIDDGEKEILRKHGIAMQKPEDIIGHEAIHHVQNQTGGIRNYKNKFGRRFREYIEGMATYMTEQIFGPQSVYTREKALIRPYVNNVGERKAIIGNA